MQIDILTLFPEMFDEIFKTSILKRAQDKGIATLNVHNIRDYAVDKHKRVDDYAYGAGAGMVMMIEPIARCIESLQKENEYDDIIYLTPDGELLNQPLANQISTQKNLCLLCGHYKGIDQRIRDKYITREISVGDFVLSGGELAAAVLSDSIIRLIPGVLNDETSALSDSFQNGLLAPPVYTRPFEYDGLKVPEILLSGNEKAIEEWKMEKSIERTKERRPGMLNE